MALESNFYETELWFESVLNFYASRGDMPDKLALFQPVKDITNAISKVCTLYAEYPENIVDFLKVSINPFISNDGFRSDVLHNLHAAADESNQPGYHDMAEALLFLRQCYESDFDMLRKRYGDRIDELQLDITTFAKSVKTIANAHIGQIVSKIETETQSSA